MIHDDGIAQKLPKNTIVFAVGGEGDIPLPLIYEDVCSELQKFPKIPFENKDILCSFVGRLTHRVRKEIVSKFQNNKKFSIHIPHDYNATDYSKK